MGIDRGRLRRRAASRRRRGRGSSRPRHRRRARPRSRPLARCAEGRSRRRCRDTRLRRRTCRSSSARTFPPPRCATALVEGAGELLESLRLVDDYRGPGVAEGAKSLTFALRFRASDRTLTAAEATEAKLAGRRRGGRAIRGDAARVAAAQRPGPPPRAETTARQTMAPRRCGVSTPMRAVAAARPSRAAPLTAEHDDSRRAASGEMSSWRTSWSSAEPAG